MSDPIRVVLLPESVARKLTQIVEREDVLTEPMSLAKLDGWFDVSRAKMRAILPHLDAVKVEGLHRVPLAKMPPKYLRRHDLL